MEELYLYMYGIVFGLMIVTVIYSLLKDRGKMRAFILGADRTLILKMFKKDGGRLILNKKQDCLFDSTDIFLYRFKKFLGLRTVIAPALLIEAASWKPINLDSSGIAQHLPLTIDEVQKLIQREVAKARMNIKPINLNMFLILCALIVVNMIISLAAMRGIHF